MFKLTKTIFNSLNNKNYLRNKESLELYNLSAINRIPLDKQSSEMQEIVKLEEEHRRINLQVYIRNMAKLRVKQAVLIATPILLGGLTVASFVNGKFIKTKTYKNVCQNTQMEFDENFLYNQEEALYTYKNFDHNSVGDDIAKKLSIDSDSYAIFYYGEGSNSFQVKFHINDDNTWQYNSHTTNLYEKSANPPKEAIGTLDDKYKELIKEATETFIKQADLSEEEIAYLRELVSNNENDIIVKVNKNIGLGDKDLDVYAYHWIRCALLVIADIVLLILAIKFGRDFKEVQKLKVNNSRLEEPYGSVFPNLLTAASKYRQAFLEAEDNRINSINNLLTDCGGSNNILSKYEKRLVKENAKKLE